MPSTVASPNRRQPKQARAAQRRAAFLDTAARLIGERGFDAVTMTAVAEQAGASIGTLYDYFPDKQALAQALAGKYVDEADEHWKNLLGGTIPRGSDELADLFVDGAMKFVRERPAYLPLFGSPFLTFRSPAARQHLRKAFTVAILRLTPELTREQALLKAQVVVELIKAMLTVCQQVAPKFRDTINTEFKSLLRSYMDENFGTTRVAPK